MAVGADMPAHNETTLLRQDEHTQNMTTSQAWLVMTYSFVKQEFGKPTNNIFSGKTKIRPC